MFAQISPCRGNGTFMYTTSPRTSSRGRSSSGISANSSAVINFTSAELIAVPPRPQGMSSEYPNPPRLANRRKPRHNHAMTDREFATDVVRRLREAGFEALWAGGCVRDRLLGREP